MKEYEQLNVNDASLLKNCSTIIYLKNTAFTFDLFTDAIYYLTMAIYH